MFVDFCINCLCTFSAFLVYGIIGYDHICTKSVINYSIIYCVKNNLGHSEAILGYNGNRSNEKSN